MDPSRGFTCNTYDFEYMKEVNRRVIVLAGRRGRFQFHL
jgi:hypothetical protein